MTKSCISVFPQQTVIGIPAVTLKALGEEGVLAGGSATLAVLAEITLLADTKYQTVEAT